MPVPGIEGDEDADEPEIEADENGDPTVRGPHPCQHPDCTEDADASTGYTYCEDHADLGGDDPDDPPEGELRDDPADADLGQPAETEPDVAEVELTDDDFGGGGDLFDDVEDADDRDDDLDGDESDDPLDALDDRGEALEGAINEGFARLGVAGLPEDDQDDLEGEFTEIFEAFRLGYFGSRVVEEYVFVDGEDEVDPAWGFAGSAFCALAIIVWMRPDGDEQLARVTDSVGNIAGGAA